MEETQNLQQDSKLATSAKEAAYHWELAPIIKIITTPILLRRVGQNIWPHHAPKARRNQHRDHIIARSSRRGVEEARGELRAEAKGSRGGYDGLWWLRPCLLSLWPFLATNPESMHIKKVQSFRSLREEEVGNLIEYINSSLGEPINLSETISLLTNGIISRAAFGSRCKYGNEFISVVKEASQLAGGFDMFDLFPSLKFLPFLSKKRPVFEKLHKRLDKVLQNIIDEHRIRA